jgi:hypothetical protein
MVLNIVRKEAYAIVICEKAFGSEELQFCTSARFN